MTKRNASIAFMLGLCVLLAGGCTAEPNGFTLSLVNDTSSVVKIEQCAGSGRKCKIAAYTSVTSLSPGQSMVTGQVPDGDLFPIVVFSKSGVTIGCLPFRFTKSPPSTMLVRVSQKVSCGDSLGNGVSGGRDWPFLQY